MTDMTKVKRFNSTQPLASVTGGHWVKASDYDALADKLAEVERALATARIALEAAEKLHQIGIWDARIDLPKEVVAKRSDALAAIRALIQTDARP